jgi:hypoxia up-regulated 1
VIVASVHTKGLLTSLNDVLSPIFQANRFPLAHFPYIKPLLAATEVPQSTIYPVQPIKTANGTLVFPHVSAPSIARQSDDDSTVTWSPEEILAQQFAYVKLVAEDTAKEAITDLYVTVPSYFSQPQRRAIKDAAEIAGLHVVGMISEGAAVGLNFAMTRSFPQKEYHLIYDSGAMKTTATILSFETRPDELPPLKTKTKVPRVPNNSTYVDVVAFDSQSALGGVNLDYALRELMIADFEAGKGKDLDIRNDPRAMRRLWKEAGRAKSVLSANQMTTVNVGPGCPERHSPSHDFAHSSLWYRANPGRIIDQRHRLPIKDNARSAGGSVRCFQGQVRFPHLGRVVKGGNVGGA